MGQKTHPIGFRLGIVKTWDSRWFAKKDYAKLIEEDLMIKKYIRKRLQNSGISKIIIQRSSNRVDITIHTSKPGMVIGKSGAQVNQLRDELQHVTSKDVFLDIKSIDNPDLDAFWEQYDPYDVRSTLKDELTVNPYLRFNDDRMIAFLKQRGLPISTEYERWESLMTVY